MPQGKRERLSIIHDILLIVQKKKSARPTQILYQANLSHEMLSDYLSELLEKGFLTEEKLKGGRRAYSLTKKGESFLQDYNSIRGFLEAYGLS